MTANAFHDHLSARVVGWVVKRDAKMLRSGVHWHVYLESNPLYRTACLYADRSSATLFPSLEAAREQAKHALRQGDPVRIFRVVKRPKATAKPVVIIDEHGPATGWAVFTGCEGDDPSLVAIFFRRTMAERFIAACKTAATVGEDHALCDPDICPAALMGILVANHFNFREGVEALIARAGPSLDDADAFREEAAQ